MGLAASAYAQVLAAPAAQAAAAERRGCHARAKQAVGARAHRRPRRGPQRELAWYTGGSLSSPGLLLRRLYCRLPDVLSSCRTQGEAHLC